MPEPAALAAAVAAHFSGDLAGLKLLVSAGPTVEDIDPVRFISNRSSGKMGYAIAQRAAERGEKVPGVMCAHPSDNRLIPALGKTPLGGAPIQYRMIPQDGPTRFSRQTSWESPDPNFWVPAGYAVVNMNMPGYASSGGPVSYTHLRANETQADIV